MTEANPIRLYSIEEIRDIYQDLGMAVLDGYADFTGAPSSPYAIQLMVCSKKL